MPGEITCPYPTVTNLAVEWEITGDDNLNSAVSVRYRRRGEESWKNAMPLRRVPAGSSRGTTPIFNWKNKHSGSIFDLRPDSIYEIELKLVDPDGGSAEKTVHARTRPVPRPGAGEVVNVSPGSHGVLTPRDGSPGRPVIYRCPQGEAVFESINLRNRKWVYIDGLTVRNTASGRSSKGVTMGGAENCAVRYCTINAVFGVVAYKPGARNCYISDNVITGTTEWRSETMGAHGKNIGEGIEITGPGNVVCFNRVKGFRDAISTMEDTGTVDQHCIDIYNNDVYLGADDGIEADFCMSNCRIMRNRLTNCFVGLSSQPGLGGPTYFIRNSMYNLTYAPYKLHRHSRGDVILHNTVVKVGDGMACFAGEPFDFAFFRNNLAIGGPSTVNWGDYGAGRGMAAYIASHGPHCSFDYDAVGTYQTAFNARIGGRSFTAAEPHGVRVDMNVFKGVPFPIQPVPELGAQDLRPVPGARVVDAGVRIPNVNDGFTGMAPDIGAYELGQELPIYGPRPRDIDEETTFLQQDRAASTSASGQSPRILTPTTVSGPDETAVAAACKAVEDAVPAITALSRSRIIGGVGAGRNESVYIDLGGSAVRVKITGAAEQGLMVEFAAGSMPVPWNSLSGRRFAGIAAKYAEDNADNRIQTAALYAAAGDIEKSSEIIGATEGASEQWRTLAESLKILYQAR